MLSTYFENSRTIEQLRSGPADFYLDGFANHLHLDGYAPETARRYLRAAVHLGLWVDTVNCLIEDLNEEFLATFASHLPCCACNRASKDKSPDIIIGAQHFFNYLRRLGVIRLEKDERLLSPCKPLFKDFCKWMQQHRGVTDRTLEIYRPAVVDLLNKLGDNPNQYQVQDIRCFIFDRLKQCGRGKGKNTVSALRMFLRFLSVEGLCSADYTTEFLLGNDLHHGTFSAEHSFSVDPDNQNGGGRERERVVRLCVGPDRIVALKMEQCREQDAAARFVK